MKLLKYRVTNFRSVEDSGWIETDGVTALIGTNESGKTNVLLPLWKFNPAKEGEISPTADYPRKHYNDFRHLEAKPVFIEAIFRPNESLAGTLATKAGLPKEMFAEISVARRFDGEYTINYPLAAPARTLSRERVTKPLGSAETEISAISPMKTEEDLKPLILAAITSAKSHVPTTGEVDAETLGRITAALESVKTESAPKSGLIAPRHGRAVEELKALAQEISRPHPRDVDSLAQLVQQNLPKFVYYSTYGNLDSEIYLPHVIQNLERKDLGTKEQAKARTLKVLFEFVRLQPDEIQELGHDFRATNRQPTDDEIAEINEKKKTRSILLQSASTMLTKKFRDWWKQGEYRFRFEADGDHFRIWVSDDKRPEEIELEGRSTGLQWFLSFYLVFLVERADTHEGAILLLDEPGLSLHPLAQRDLSEFFDSLASVNQLLYTCHSPFLVDADRLDRARKVYVAADGTSKVTADLRASDGDIAQRGAAYAVHAALGLTVAESLLLGCEPVVVEGVSDQHYLSGIKTVLVAAGQLRPGRELVFPPAGGTKGVKAVASILGGRDEQLPVALFDDDEQGRATAASLKQGLYATEHQRVLNISSFTGVAESEIEDLLPSDLIVGELDKWLRVEHAFADVFKAGAPIVPQIEAWAAAQKIELRTPGWKVELAKRVKQRLIATGATAVTKDVLDRWSKLFEAFDSARSKAATISGK